MNIYLYDDRIEMLGVRLDVFSPNTFWPYLNKYASRWDEPHYQMFFHTSEKQDQAATRMVSAIGAESATHFVAELATVAKSAVQTVSGRKVVATVAAIAKYGLKYRFCQKASPTRQVHYGSKLSDTEGCLLIKAPAWSQLQKSITPASRSLLTRAQLWDVKAVWTQMFLYALANSIKTSEEV